MVVGTPEYMAPEQARGQQDIGPAADVFSLGCVLFECLTGRAPFAGEHIAAVLAKILFDDAPRLRALRPELPEALEELLLRMLHKDPRQRLPDAQAVLAAVQSLGEVSDAGPPEFRPMPRPAAALGSSLQTGEQQLVCVVYATKPQAIRTREQKDEFAGASTVEQSQTETPASFAALRTSLLVLGVHAEQLADGSLVATVMSSVEQSAATDQAVLAARSALIIHEHWPQAIVGISTGRGVLRAELPIGEAVDRAARLLQRPGRDEQHRVILDGATAGLLDSRFELSPLPSGCFALVGEHQSLDITRPLLGKPTPCVGREQELAMLKAVLAGCIEESSARAVLVVAPSGLGKSRLRHEFMRIVGEGRYRDGENDDDAPPPAVLLARAEPSHKGAPYALFGQALRRFLGLPDHRAAAADWPALRARVAERLGNASEEDATRVAECLGEILSLPQPESPHPILRGARTEPRRLAELVSAGLCDYLLAECLRQPLLIILEDLQWADTPSLRLSEAVLRVLSEQPIFFLGLCRPEAEERIARLWQERGRQEIRLAPLGRRASEQLIKRVLGPKVPPATMARIVEQAGGNALLLEELIRAVAEGHGDELPETVLAMVQVRIGRLDATARRVLRAASIFGESFSAAGVAALYGAENDVAHIVDCLQHLIDAEILEPSKQGGEGKAAAPGMSCSFRHSLLREAAYSLLTDDDRQLGHRLAAAFLEAQGAATPQIIAEHYDKAGETERALGFYLQAAELAFLSSDMKTVEENLTRVEVEAPTGEALGLLHSLRSVMALIGGDLQGAVDHSRTAIELLPAGGERWCRAVAVHSTSAGLSGQVGSLVQIVEQFERATPQKEARSDFVVASSFISRVYTYLGMREAALNTLSRAELLAGDRLDEDAMAESSFFRALALVHHRLGTSPALAYTLMERALRASQRMQHPRQAISTELELGDIAILFEDPAELEARARAALQKARQLGEPFVLQGVGAMFTAMLVQWGHPQKQAEAKALGQEIIEQLGNNLTVRGVLQAMLGEAQRLLGEDEQAIADLELAAESLIMMPGLRVIALSYLLQALVKRGDAEKAAHVAAQAEDLLAMLGHAGSFDATLRLSIAEAHMLNGDHEAGLRALQIARQQLLSAAATLPEEAQRQRYLHGNRYHARILELTAQQPRV
jgi:hypothetical protein